MGQNVDFPTPGIEPGPPGWEPGILTTRQCRIAIDVCNKSILFLIDFYVRLKCHVSLTPFLYAGKMMATEKQSWPNVVIVFLYYYIGQSVVYFSFLQNFPSWHHFSSMEHFSNLDLWYIHDCPLSFSPRESRFKRFRTKILEWVFLLRALHWKWDTTSHCVRFDSTSFKNAQVTSNEMVHKLSLAYLFT